MTQRYRIGIVCGSLTQGGGGRYAYELCRAIDQSRFEVGLLTIAPWGVKHHYYADHIRRLGIRVREILPLFNFRRLPARLRPPALAVQNAYRSSLLPVLLSRYDLISALSLDYFLDVEQMLPRSRTPVVHLLNHLHQYSYNRFLDWPVGRFAHFICMDRFQEHDMTVNLGAVVKTKTIVPLLIDPSQFQPITEWPNPRRLVIASFMRIERDRQSLPLLRAFALVAKEIDAEMRFYGHGVLSEIDALRAEAAQLGVSDRVKFPGHSSNIRRTILEDGVTFSWLTACNDELGYSGIELSLLAVPTFCFNVEPTETTEEVLLHTDGAIHNYSAEKELADATVAAWKSPDYVTEVGRSLRLFMERVHNSKRNIRQIEAFYENAIGQSSEFSRAF
jgi:glycosyltransferase involved in cell wall biosynthesis